MAVSRPVLFEHLPKTAGSTFNFILSRQYPHFFHISGIDPLDSIQKFRSLPPEEQKAFSLVHGHAALELESCLDHPFLITFLRDPVDQFLSQYYFIQNNKRHKSHGDVSRITSIEDYLGYSKEHCQDNLQTRVLSKNLSWISGKATEADRDFHSCFEEAFKNLERFDTVLLTGRFDESLLLLKKRLGWKKTPVYFRINRTRHRLSKKEQDLSLIHKIERHQAYDMQLYERALQCFEEYLPDLPQPEELKRFRKNNRWYQKVVYPLCRMKGFVVQLSPAARHL